MFCRFSGSFEPIFDPNCRGNINFRILPLQFESKSGQNNPEKPRTINFERGLLNKSFLEGVDSTLASGSGSAIATYRVLI
jgi:hypothetical protein